MASVTITNSSPPLVSHWSKLFESFSTDPLPFYSAVEGALANRDIPNLRISRVEWKEGGAFTARREYLRVEWRRYCLDICAAPFGSGFFFSSWLTMKPPSLTIVHVGGMLISLFGIWFFVAAAFGTFKGILVSILALTLLYGALRRGLIQSTDEAHEFLLGLTIIGPFIDLFHREITYFEMDTASMFQGASHAAVLEVVDQVTSAKGVRPLTELERKPEMRDFFKK